MEKKGFAINYTRKVFTTVTKESLLLVKKILSVKKKILSVKNEYFIKSIYQSKKAHVQATS